MAQSFRRHPVPLNFGKQIVYNHFGQNHFLLGFTYHPNNHYNLPIGYMNVFQQLTSGNKYRSISYGKSFLLSRS